MILCDAGKLTIAQATFQFLKENAEKGQLYFAVGGGDSNWDSGSDPAALTVKRTQLVKEFSNGRVPISVEDIQYVIPADSYTGSEESVSTEPTLMIRVNANINIPETVREYGLFINASSISNSGDLLVYDIHPKIVLGQLNLYMKYIYINF